MLVRGVRVRYLHVCLTFTDILVFSVLRALS